jgi:hypothetical protein
MRKNVGTPVATEIAQQSGGEWLDIEKLARVEVTSENPDFPIESVFSAGRSTGWRAAEPGRQRIRLVFDEPTAIHRIQLHFSETEIERTQEFTLRWAAAEGNETREIVRQRWNFSPQGSMREVEDYRVELSGVTILELDIEPDVSQGHALASLAHWLVGSSR